MEIVASGEKIKVLKRCQSDEPIAREIETHHWAGCHQIPGYDAAPVTMANLTHKRQVVAKAIDSDTREAGKVIQEAVT